MRVIDDPFGQVVVLQVEDTGPGIPQASASRCSGRSTASLGTGVDGSGLGLAIVREIATRHGAEITLDDADARRRDRPGAAGEGGPGALFTVRFRRRRRPQLCTSRRLFAIDISRPRPRPSVTIAVPP